MSPKSNEDFAMFDTLDVQGKDLARKAYRAVSEDLVIYIEGDSQPHELCNISISGLCFKLNTPEEEKTLTIGQRLEVHLFSEIHDDILSVHVQVVRTDEGQCSCFFPLLVEKEETFLDKLILEMQKREIALQKIERNKELEREKIEIQERRKLQQRSQLQAEEAALKGEGLFVPLSLSQNANINSENIQNLDNVVSVDNSKLDKQIKNDQDQDKSINIDKKTNKEPSKESNTSKINDFTVSKDITISTDSSNKKTYTTIPMNLWLYIKGESKPHKILNLNSSEICFSYKKGEGTLADENAYSVNSKISVKIFHNIRERVLVVPAKIMHIEDDVFFCKLPSLDGDNMVLLSKFLEERKKSEISADSIEELHNLAFAYEKEHIQNMHDQIKELGKSVIRIQNEKRFLQAILEEEKQVHDLRRQNTTL